MAEGFLIALGVTRDALGLTEREFLGALDVVGYGATTVLNSVLTRQGGTPGLLITRGFEDLLLMERGKQSWVGLDRVDRIHPVTHRHQVPLIPKSRVRVVSERVDSVGDVVVPLREEDVRIGAEEFSMPAPIRSSLCSSGPSSLMATSCEPRRSWKRSCVSVGLPLRCSARAT